MTREQFDDLAEALALANVTIQEGMPENGDVDENDPIIAKTNKLLVQIIDLADEVACEYARRNDKRTTEQRLADLKVELDRMKAELDEAGIDYSHIIN